MKLPLIERHQYKKVNLYLKTACHLLNHSHPNAQNNSKITQHSFQWTIHIKILIDPAYPLWNDYIFHHPFK